MDYRIHSTLPHTQYITAYTVHYRTYRAFFSVLLYPQYNLQCSVCRVYLYLICAAHVLFDLLKHGVLQVRSGAGRWTDSL